MDHCFLLFGEAERPAPDLHHFMNCAGRVHAWADPPRAVGHVFSGWMVDPASAFDLVVDLHVEFWPRRFHCVLDGAAMLPAGRLARQRLRDEVDVDELESWCRSARERGVPLEINLLGRHRQAHQRVVELLGRQHVEIVARWTERQAALVRGRRQGARGRELATRYGCTRQSIYESVVRSRHTELTAIETAIRDWIHAAVHDRPWPSARRAPRILI